LLIMQGAVVLGLASFSQGGNALLGKLAWLSRGGRTDARIEWDPTKSMRSTEAVSLVLGGGGAGQVCLERVRDAEHHCVFTVGQSDPSAVH
jgi:hypothetical protein